MPSPLRCDYSSYTPAFVWPSVGEGKPHPDPDHPDYVPLVSVDGENTKHEEVSS